MSLHRPTSRLSLHGGSRGTARRKGGEVELDAGSTLSSSGGGDLVAQQNPDQANA